MKKLFLLLIAASMVLPACKKDYDCQCTNSKGTYNAGTIKNTKLRAKKQCQDLSTGETKCNI